MSHSGPTTYQPLPGNNQAAMASAPKPYDQPPPSASHTIPGQSTALFSTGQQQGPPRYGTGGVFAGSRQLAESGSGRTGTFLDDDGEDDDYLQEFIKVEFDDIIREPNGTQMIEACRSVNVLTYTWSKNLWYGLLTLLTGLLCSVWWGFWFATYAYFISWWWYPFTRLTKMTIYMWAVLYRAMCRAFMHPLYESISIMFTNIRVKFHQKGPGPQLAAVQSA